MIKGFATCYRVHFVFINCTQWQINVEVAMRMLCAKIDLYRGLHTIRVTLMVRHA